MLGGNAAESFLQLAGHPPQWVQHIQEKIEQADGVFGGEVLLECLRFGLCVP
jgi:hypothetical protein